MFSFDFVKEHARGKIGLVDYLSRHRGEAHRISRYDSRFIVAKITSINRSSGYISEISRLMAIKRNMDVSANQVAVCKDMIPFSQDKS